MTRILLSLLLVRSWLAPVENAAAKVLVIGIDLCGPDNVIIVSDHGFKAAEEGANIWITAFADLLASNDRVPGRDHFTVISTFSRLVTQPLTIDRRCESRRAGTGT